jgi:hypothetical protein
MAIRGQGLVGDADAVRVKAMPFGPVQLLKVVDVISAIGLDRCLPLFIWSVVAPDAHDTLRPVVVSVSVTLPTLPMVTPPGSTIQCPCPCLCMAVVAVVAEAVVAVVAEAVAVMVAEAVAAATTAPTRRSTPRLRPKMVMSLPSVLAMEDARLLGECCVSITRHIL